MYYTYTYLGGFIMIKSMAAKQAQGKCSNDVIFVANALAVATGKRVGPQNVVNGTIGAILDEDGELVFLKTVEETFRNLPRQEYAAYAPIKGLPEYLDCVIDQCFGKYRPEGHIEAIATAGGTGVVHHLIHNYTEPGDEVLTHDWFWGAYSSLCDDNLRSLHTFELFTTDGSFNHVSFQQEVLALAAKQEQLLIILNTPAHNPTGFTIPVEDWQKILDFLKDLVSKGENKIVLDVDVAYLDYSAPKDEAREFFAVFSNLPAEILTVVGYSMSKAYTVYGQRMGAMIAVTSSPEVAKEFSDVNSYTSRATWSNTSRPTMRTMVQIASDPAKQKAYEEERNQYYELIKERAAIFMEEAQNIGLPVVPYKAGFFISVPSPDTKAVCEALHKDNIFLVPLKKGIRIAACAVPKRQMKGLAQKIYDTMKELGQL